MKANGFIYIILGILIAVAIYSLVQLNKISKIKNTNTNTNSTKRILQADITEVEPEQQSEPVLRENVTAKELADAVREKLNEQKVESLNITFTK